MSFPSFVSGEVLTAADMNAVGLWLINTTSFTGATQVDFTNVFSANYDSYRVEFHFWTASVSENHLIRLRDSGGVITTNNYLTQRLESVTSTVTGLQVGGGLNSSWFPTFIAGSGTAGAGVAGYFDIFQPNVTGRYTRANGKFVRTDSTTDVRTIEFAGIFNLTTVLTGFSIVRNSTATMEGKVSVYGIRN